MFNTNRLPQMESDGLRLYARKYLNDVFGQSEDSTSEYFTTLVQSQFGENWPLEDINTTKSHIFASEKRLKNLEAFHALLFANMVWVHLQQQLHKPLVRLLWLRLLVAKNSYFMHSIAKNFWSQTFMKRYQFRSLARLTLIFNVET